MGGQRPSHWLHCQRLARKATLTGSRSLYSHAVAGPNSASPSSSVSDTGHHSLMCRSRSCLLCCRFRPLSLPASSGCSSWAHIALSSLIYLMSLRTDSAWLIRPGTGPGSYVTSKSNSRKAARLSAACFSPSTWFPASAACGRAMPATGRFLMPQWHRLRRSFSRSSRRISRASAP